jgi:hypothetical protein
VAVTVRDPRASPLQSLHQPWNVEDRRKLKNHVDVIGYDPNGEGGRAVALRLLWQEPIEELC